MTIMARAGALDYGRRSNYHISRSRIVLLAAFIVQGFVAYHYGARSTHIKSPTFATHPPGHTSSGLPITYNSISKSGFRARFVMGCMNDHERSYDLLVIGNRNKYAAKQGYDMLWDFEKSSGSHSKDWDRLTSMEKIINGKLKGKNDYEWIWWSDYDLIITNSSITLESIVEETLGTIEDISRRSQIDIIMRSDCFRMNSGSLPLRTTQWSLDWIKEMWRQSLILNEENRMRSLQDCLGDMVKADGLGIKHKGRFVKQWKINAFLSEINCHEDNRPWQKGDFAIQWLGLGHMSKV